MPTPAVKADLLFWDDDDGCVQVHVDVDGLVSFQCILETGSCLPADTFESLSRSILAQ